MPKHPHIHLTARTDIGPYRRGDHVEDHAAVNAIVMGEHAAHFVRVAADNEVEPVKALNAPVEKPPAEAKA